MTGLQMGLPLRVAFGEELTELATRDDRIVVLDGDTGNSTRTDIFEAAHPGRFFQMGIAEQNMIGMAAGMATLGFIPFVSTFSCFIVSRAHDSIRVLVAQPRLNVKLMSGYAGLLAGMTGKTHLLMDDVAIMRSMANMTVVAPADERETRRALGVIVDHPGPVYLRLTRPATPIVTAEDHPFQIGSVVTLRSGSDVTLFSTGTQTPRAVVAAQMLAEYGIDVHLVHIPTIKPLDTAAIVEHAVRTGLVMTTEEHTIVGGLGSAVAEVLGEHHPLPLRRHGLADGFAESGPDEALLDKYGISAPRLAASVRSFLERQTA